MPIFSYPFEIDQSLIDRLVAEAHRVGKNPWCCSGVHEDIAYNILNGNCITFKEKYPQELMEETQARREKEKEEWGCKTWEDWRNHPNQKEIKDADKK